MNSILVSLVIPAYNVESLIGLTLDSVKNQTLKNFECIIVDDKSTDETRQIISSYVKDNENFRSVFHKANAGLSAARNTGMRLARGKYIAFLDADDLLMPESLELRAKTLEECVYKNIVGTYCGSATIDMHAIKPPDKKSISLRVVDFITAGGNCPFNANQPMFITDIFKKFGGFDHSLRQAEDYNMWMRILRCGYRVVPTNEKLVTYRQTIGSMIKANPLLHLDTSYSNFSSCYKPLTKASYNSKFNNNLSLGLATYLSEINIASRVLEFCGLALAKGEFIDDIAQRLCEYLPNYFALTFEHREFFSGINKGIKRYYSGDVEKVRKTEISLKVHRLYQTFKALSATTKVKDSSMMAEIEGEGSLGSDAGLQETICLAFIPHKDYHVYTISLMEPFLKAKDISFVVVDISMHYRDEGVQRACEKYNLPKVGYSNFQLGNFKCKGIVVFNDWDPIVRSIVHCANSSGIPTVGVVEGIQDYNDADTKQCRKAYRTVDTLILPGKFDEKYFEPESTRTVVGGVPRVYDLFNKFGDRGVDFSKNNRVLINTNFSYGVLEECRDEWLRQAVDAVRSAGKVPVITRHPADKGSLYPELVTTDSFYEALLKCSVLISRFASGILEALSCDVLPVYFNPHGEKVDKFFNSLGAYPVVNDCSDLISVLQSSGSVYEECKPNFRRFLEDHCGRLDLDPAETIAKTLEQQSLAVSDFSVDYELFSEMLAVVDMESECFSNLPKLRALNEQWSSQGKIENLNKSKREFNLSDVYRFLDKGAVQKARDIALTLREKEPDCPAYNSALNVIRIVSESGARNRPSLVG